MGRRQTPNLGWAKKKHFFGFFNLIALNQWQLNAANTMYIFDFARKCVHIKARFLYGKILLCPWIYLCSWRLNEKCGKHWNIYVRNKRPSERGRYHSAPDGSRSEHKYSNATCETLILFCCTNVPLLAILNFLHFRYIMAVTMSKQFILIKRKWKKAMKSFELCYSNENNLMNLMWRDL